MSIHGFMDQNGQIQKYDYADLENKPTIPAEVLIDDTLTEEGQAADAKAVGDALDNITIPIDSSLSDTSTNPVQNRVIYQALQNTGLSQAAKTALLAIFQHVAYIDEYGQDYYDDLEEALSGGQSYAITYNLTGCTSSNTSTHIIEGQTYTATITASSGYTMDGATATATMGGQTVTGFYNNGTISIPNVTGDLVITVTASSAVTSISAVFTQGSATIYDTDSLDTLRQYLTVTATYTDSTTATVTDYTLSGVLASGTSTITVSYGGKTDTFNVTVVYWNFEWDYSMGRLEDQQYWHADIAGTCSSTLEENGQKLVAAALSGRNISIVPADADYYRIINGKGTIEAVASLHETASTTVGFKLGIGPANGVERAGGILTTTAGQMFNTYIGSTETPIISVQNDRDYTFRLVMDGNVGYVYLDGQLVKTIEAPADTVYAGRCQVGWQNGGSGNYCLLKSVKIYAEGV